MEKNQIAEYKNKPVKITGDFTYTAHTGCMDTKENSLESIEIGAEYGANIVEFDVRYMNGVPVLSHDEPRGGEVTLKEAFLKVKEYENLKVNVDMKSVEYAETVKAIAKETGVTERIFFTGIEEKDVEVIKKNCEGIEYYLNVDVVKPKKQNAEYIQSLVEKVESVGAVGINMNKDNATQEIVDAFHKKGLLVSIWTVSQEGDIYEILSLGPDNITTRRPDKLREALKEINYIN